MVSFGVVPVATPPHAALSFVARRTPTYSKRARGEARATVVLEYRRFGQRYPAERVVVASFHPQYGEAYRSCVGDSVRQAGEDVLEKNSAEALTWGQFKTKLAAALDVDVLVLKVHREQLKELVAKYTAQTDSDEGNQDDEEEDSDGMTAMRAMARAMNLG